MAINQLLLDYRRHALEHGVATEAGDHRKANRHHELLIATLNALRQSGPDAERALTGFFTDENASVRCWAATHCLKIDEKQACSTLELLSATPGILGFNARMVLAEWRKGTLRIP